MPNIKDNSRRNFFKKLPFSIGSTVALAGLFFNETNPVTKSAVKSITMHEANEIIKNSSFNQNIKLAPKPAPTKNA